MSTVSKKEFAEMAGVSPARVTVLCRDGGGLSAAVVGGRIDTAHPDAIAYLEKRGVTPAVAPRPPRGRAAIKQRKRDEAARNPLPQVPEDIAQFVDMTLREVIEKFGTDIRFKDWLDATKRIEEIQEKRIKNAQASGELISRELVSSHVFSVIDGANRRLLTDSPKTIARELYSAAKASMSIEEAEAMVREIISGQLRAVKTTAKRVLKNA